MTEALKERDRITRYTPDEARRIFSMEGTGPDDASYLAAIMIDMMVHKEEESSEGQLIGMPTKSIRVYETAIGSTGYVHVPGLIPIIIINEDEMLDYDLISNLHPTKDAHVYMWMTAPYESDHDIQLYNIWYRDETYPDTYKEDNE